MTPDWEAEQARVTRLETEHVEMERRIDRLTFTVDQQAIHIHELMRRADFFQKLVDHLIAIATE